MMENIPHNMSRSIVYLSENLYLYSYKCNEPMRVVFAIECARLRALNFSLSFKGTINMKVENVHGNYDEKKQVLQSDIGPYERVALCTLVIVDNTMRAVLNTSYSWEIRSLSIPQNLKHTTSHNRVEV